jgi:threonine/homoserine/homoserine lactone efflux protein
MITLLFLRSSSGKRTAWAFVAGMTTTRLLQGGIFGLVLANAAKATAQQGGQGLVLSVVLLVLGIVFLATGAKSMMTGDDPDAPPPKWLTMTESMKPAKAFLFGAALLLVAPKFWIFTLGAIGAIGAANLGQPSASLMFLLFVVLAQFLSLAVLVYAAVAPRQSEHVLDAAAAWLRSHNRVMMIVIGLVFGIWFSVKGLVGLGLF